VSEAFVQLAELIRLAGVELRLYGRPVTEAELLEFATLHVRMRKYLREKSDMTSDEVKEGWQPSDELDGIPIGSAEQERRRAKAWMDTAAQHLRNEHYWRKRAEAAEEKVRELEEYDG